MDNQVLQVLQVWHVNKNLPTPLFKQLAENIKWSIYSGSIKPGSKLPPVHTMAKALGVSVSTVQAAYKLLEELHLVSTRPHHGTEILAFSDSCGSDSDSDTVDESFVNLIKAYMDLGFSDEKITTMFHNCMTLAHSKKKILFIECDEYDRLTLAKQLSDFLGVGVDFLLLDKTFNSKNTNDDYKDVDFSKYMAIVTTYFHHSKVTQDLAYTKLPVFTVVTEFSRKTMLDISKFLPETKVAVLSQPHHSAEYEVGLIDAIRDDLDIKIGIVDEKNNQKELIEWAEVIFSTHPCELVAKEICPEKPIYFFCDQINSQSMGILKDQLQTLDTADTFFKPAREDNQ